MTRDILQWIGAVFIIAGHALNAMGPEVYPYNIIAFAIGTIMFLTWAALERNKPQTLVNVVSLSIGLVGLYKAWA
jgi:hypothetical protein